MMPLLINVHQVAKEKRRENDAVIAAAYNRGFEFKNVVGTAQEYYYDLNGNLTKDSNKGITEIKYSVLNLPSKQFEMNLINYNQSKKINLQ